MPVKQFVIKTQSPQLLGDTLNGLPMVNADVGDDFDGEKVTVLIAGNPDFAEHALRTQGYGEVVSVSDLS